MPDRSERTSGGRSLRVTALQVGPAAASPSSTLTSVLGAAEQAIKETEAQLLVLTELATTPYFCGVEDEEWFSWAEPLDGPSVSAFSRLAAGTGCHIVLPFFEVTEDRTYYNSAVVIDDQGQLVPGQLPGGRAMPTYRKIHLPASQDEVTGELRSNEPWYFTPGTEAPVFDTRHGRLGILICWDKRFSELWRILGLRGAELVCNPICTWGDWRAETYPMELQVMAMTNQFFVAGVSKGGTENIGCERRFSGGAHIASPNGSLLASSPAAAGGYASAVVDLDAVADFRRTTPIYRDRRPDVYGELAANR